MLDMQDRQAVQDLVVLYAHLCDTLQLERVAAEIFTEDATMDYGTGLVQGRAQIHAFYTGNARVIATSHNVSNFLIDGTGDRADCLCKVMAWHWFGDGQQVLEALPPADMLAIGGYQDALRRTVAGWRIQARRCVQFGSGLGVGEPGLVRPILTGLLGRLPEWPAP